MKNKNLSRNLSAAEPSPLSKQIGKWLDNRRIYHDFLTCGSSNSTTLCKTGTPDRFCVIRGQIIFVEIKTPGEKPTPEQNRRRDKRRENGAIVVVCESFDEFTNQFSAIRRAIETGEKELIQ